jgi:hypothetical protein
MLVSLGVFLAGTALAVGLAWLVLSGVLLATFRKARLVVRRLVERRATDRGTADRRGADRRGADRRAD